jgi:quercetin dioxygenase-like cupin family protein
MPSSPPTPALSIVLEAVDPDALVRFMTEELGLRIERVSPADAPDEITMSGLGGHVTIRRSDRDGPAHLVVEAADQTLVERGVLRAPNGTVIEPRHARPDLIIPDSRPSLSIVRAEDDVTAGVGRAGMIYRDLLPDRWGGRFIASHIGIPGGGDVPDWVHYHRVRFQMIFCAAGWVDVVYEDQGEPFRLEAGDGVLQPPEIRHRVLRSSPGLEVIEIGCPAVHDTIADHRMELPTPISDGERDFDGQRFVRHVASTAGVAPWLIPGLAYRDTEIGRATRGLAGARIVTAAGGSPGHPAVELTHRGEIVFDVVVAGSAEFGATADGVSVVETLGRGDALAIPPGGRWRWSRWTDDFELLEVTLPADAVGAIGAMATGND